MTIIRAMSRPAQIVSSAMALDEEMRAAGWLHHRLLDFEDEHQRVLNVAAELAAPGITRVARLVARLLGRQKRRERTTTGQWSPNPHPSLISLLRGRLSELRELRNKDEGWTDACKWADTPADDAPDRGGIRRKSDETDEKFSERSQKRRTKLTRRETWRKALYDAHVALGATERSRIYWGTWNALLKQVDQARASVLSRRKSGMPAERSRPRRDDRNTIAADSGGFRIIARGGGVLESRSGAIVGDPWWTIEMRLATGWVRFRAKCANWHEIPADAKPKTCSLTRDHGQFSVSIVVEGLPDELTYSVDAAPNFKGRRELLNGLGVVSLDWGHREHGHPGERDGIRVFTWLGDDGRKGEVLLPAECRQLLSAVDEMKARVDDAFNARKATLHLTERNRYGYRARLMRSGAVREEESRWLTWETRYERRMSAARDRIADLRRETYLSSIRDLRRSYGTFAIEDETIEPRKKTKDKKGSVGHRQLDIDEQSRHRKRQNRDMSARYLFAQFCERLGATLLPVPARNSTRECPECGNLDENTTELTIVCSGCGVARDKDFGACRVILARAQEALAKRAA